jgi:hypothetical protein
MASFGYGDVAAIVDAVPNIVRSILPWQWRSSVSNWLAWSAIAFVAAILLALAHEVFRERPKIKWDFEDSGFVVRTNQRVSATGERSYNVTGFYLDGQNISGHTIHQMDGELVLQADGRRLPLFIGGPNGWRRMDELIALPARRQFGLGAEFRPDTEHQWPGFETEMTPDQFLRAFGGFTINITVDGVKHTWRFSIDEIRNQFERLRAIADEKWLSNPDHIPQSTFR